MSEQQLPAPTGEFQLPEPAGETEDEMLARYNESKDRDHDKRQDEIKQAFADDQDQKTEAA